VKLNEQCSFGHSCSVVLFGEATNDFDVAMLRVQQVSGKPAVLVLVLGKAGCVNLLGALGCG
jgi:hypothetical protein